MGFDVTAHYPRGIETFSSLSLLDFLRIAPLFYTVMWAVHGAGVEVFLLLKITGPVLYGAMAVSFLFFLKSLQRWNDEKCVLGTLLLVFQPIMLRISWDLFRNELGLVFALLALGALRSEWRFRYHIAGLLAVLTVLAHPLAAVIMLVGVLGLLLSRNLRLDRLRAIIAFAPSTLLFLVMLVVIFGPPSATEASGRIVGLAPDPDNTFGAVLFGAFPPGDGFLGPMRLEVFKASMLLFFFAYAPMVALVVWGYWKEPALKAITLLLGLGSLSYAFPLLPIPVPASWRWEILLVVPFAVYALNGLEKLRLFEGKRVMFSAGILGMFFLVSLGYASGSFSYMGSYGSFSPVTMVQASISVDQIDDAFSSLRWLNKVAPANSYLVMDERFISFADMTLDQSIKIAVQPGGPPTQSAVDGILEFKPAALFAIWDEDLSLAGFEATHREDRITIFYWAGSMSGG